MFRSTFLSTLLLALAAPLAQAQSTVYSCTATLYIRDVTTVTVTNYQVSTSIRTVTTSTQPQYTATSSSSYTQPPWSTVTSTYTPPNPWPTYTQPQPTYTQPTPQPTTPSNPTRLNQPVSGTAQQGPTTIDGGACSLTGYTIPSGLLPVQLSTTNWNKALYCGACIQITHATTGRSTTVMVTDQGGNDANALIMHPTSYSSLLQPGGSQSILPINWSLVRCPHNSNISYKAKEGSSQYYLALQVRDARTPIQKLEVSSDGGRSWKELTREPYNYFVLQNGSGSDRVDVRLTDVEGRQIIDRNVWAVSEVITVGGGNFS